MDLFECDPNKLGDHVASVLRLAARCSETVAALHLLALAPGKKLMLKVAFAWSAQLVSVVIE